MQQCRPRGSSISRISYHSQSAICIHRFMDRSSLRTLDLYTEMACATMLDMPLSRTACVVAEKTLTSIVPTGAWEQN